MKAEFYPVLHYQSCTLAGMGLCSSKEGLGLARTPSSVKEGPEGRGDNFREPSNKIMPAESCKGAEQGSLAQVLRQWESVELGRLANRSISLLAMLILPAEGAQSFLPASSGASDTSLPPTVPVHLNVQFLPLLSLLDGLCSISL